MCLEARLRLRAICGSSRVIGMEHQIYSNSKIHPPTSVNGSYRVTCPL